MSVLDAILAHKRAEVCERRERFDGDALRRLALAAPPTRGFLASLSRPGVRVIAEVKRASPARGALRPLADVAALARRYAAAGAAAVSVLTDERYFQGSDADLRQVRQAVDLPVLRKDFVVDAYQVWEARALGADAVLLIVRALEEAALRDLRELAEALGMDALVEVHDAIELARALDTGARLVGINNRDLATLRVNLETTFRLLPLVPAQVTLVSESGISRPDEVRRLVEHGVRAVLVGEALMLADDPQQLLAELIAAGAPA